MKVIVSGRHVDVTAAMKDYALAKAEKLVQYFERATSCRVTMDVDGLDHSVEMVVQVNRGVTLVGKATAPDMYAACDLSEQKLVQQVRKYKERLTDHRRGSRRRQVDVSAPASPPAPAEATYEDVIDQLHQDE